MIDQILSTLGFSAEETKTYLLLLEQGPSTASALAKKIGAARPSVYGFLQKLQNKGIVSESLKENVKVFAAAPPATVTKLFTQHIEQLQQAKAQYQVLVPALEKSAPSQFLSPKFRFYEGAEGVQHVLKDMLLYSSIETQAYWPIASMIDILSPDFFRYLNKERIRNNLYTRAIWPENQAVSVKRHPYLGVGADFKREIRIAPKGIEFSMGYWIYGSNVAFISSRQESFGFIIESRELAEMLLSQFELIWKASKPLKVNPDDTKAFLREVERYR
jgi:sugar-specific transcriptional regulator TrmB